MVTVKLLVKLPRTVSVQSPVFSFGEGRHGGGTGELVGGSAVSRDRAL